MRDMRSIENATAETGGITSPTPDTRATVAIDSDGLRRTLPTSGRLRLPLDSGMPPYVDGTPDTDQDYGNGTGPGDGIHREHRSGTRITSINRIGQGR